MKLSDVVLACGTKLVDVERRPRVERIEEPNLFTLEAPCRSL